MPTTTNYIWDDENLLAEADGSNAIQTVYTNEPQEHGNLVSSRISGTTSYHHFDAIGSTRQLTNAAGGTTDTMIHDAWGNAVSRTGTTDIAFIWIAERGYYFDVETGLTSIRRRPYGPAIGRWMTLDSRGFVDGVNRYRYARNNPCHFVDPSGGQSCKPTFLGVNPVLSRGTFLAAMEPLGEQDPIFGFIPRQSRIGSDFTLRFSWRHGAFDLGKRGCDCCCLTVGFVQIAKYATNYESGFGQEEDWHLDGGFPYTFSAHATLRSTGEPCIRIAGAVDAIEISDSPNDLEFRYLFQGGYLRSRLLTLDQEFETCAVCLGGSPGTPGGQPEGIVARLGRIAGITVYGCVTWTHHIDWNGTVYVYDRYVDNTHRHSNGDFANIPLAAVQPSAPSNDWWKQVQKVSGP
jgi:RHS repeat-associated protein